LPVDHSRTSHPGAAVGSSFLLQECRCLIAQVVPLNTSTR
jgi:hypothetical protein